MSSQQPCNADADKVQRFSFDETDIRGVIAHLNASFNEVKERHQYPDWLLIPLGELMAGAAILSTNLKFEGRLTLQLRMANSVASLLQAEVDERGQLRAIARYDESADDTQQLAITNGQLVITIEPEQGQKYQGITLVEGGRVGAALEGYFEQSEQLASRFWLHCDGQQAAGIMLQKLPSSPAADDIPWQRLVILTETVKATELYQLEFANVLHRLYHEELLRIYPTSPLSFYCPCSQQRINAALKQLGRNELESIIAEQGLIKINCEFCQQLYQLDKSDVDQLFAVSGLH